MLRLCGFAGALFFYVVFRQYRIIQVCGLRSKIEVRLSPCRDFLGKLTE